MRVIRHILFALLTILTLCLWGSSASADYRSKFGLTPIGPYPQEFDFEWIQEIRVAKDGTIYMRHFSETFNDNFYSKLLISLDGGKLFIPIFTGTYSQYAPNDIFDIFLSSPSYPAFVYYYSRPFFGSHSLHLSDNYGRTWRRVNLPTNYRDCTLTVAPSDVSRVYMFCWDYWDRGIYKSRNYGESWTKIYNHYIYTLTVDINNPDKLYVSGYVESEGSNRFFIYDLNDTSSPIKIGGKGLPNPIVIIVQDQGNPRILYAYRPGEGCLYKSTDGGFNFEKNTVDFCGEKIYAVKAKNNYLAVATNSGLKFSKDGGKSFELLVGGEIFVMDTYDFKNFYFRKNNRFGHYNYDTGEEKLIGRAMISKVSFNREYVSAHLYKHDWWDDYGVNRIFKLDPVSGRYSMLINNNLVHGYGELESLNSGILISRHALSPRHCYFIKKDLSGAKLENCNDFYVYDFNANSIYYSDGSRIIKFGESVLKEINFSAVPFAVSKDELTIVASKDNTIYISRDGGSNFTQTALSDQNGIRDIVIDFSNSSNIVVAGGSGLYVSRNGGRSFTQKYSGNFYRARQLPNGIILALSPGRIYESSDGGETWKVREIPSLPIDVYDVTKVGNNYYIATDYGLMEIADTDVEVAKTIVLRPNGGESWNAGAKYTIRWEAPLASHRFTLRYSTDNKTTWTDIATVLASQRCSSNGTKLSCSYEWTIPAQNGRKPLSFVRVIAFDSSNKTIGTDDSDRPFAIEVLRVTSPNGGERLKVGSNHTITWQTYALTRTVARVLLQYSTDDGRSWVNITTLNGNPGRYVWRVSNTPSERCRVRVILRDSSGAEIARDISDRAFSITP